jgi:hypothetical protein
VAGIESHDARATHDPRAVDTGFQEHATMKTKLPLIALAALLPCFAAAADRYADVDAAMPNIAAVVQRSAHAIAYPALLPARKDRLYAYVEANPACLGYTLYFDGQPDCKGAHDCAVGALSVSKTRRLDPQRDLQGHDMSVEVRLANGQRALFTPGHSMGDYWPAQIQWIDGGASYTLTWNGAFPDGEKQTLVTLANSVRAAAATR